MVRILSQKTISITDTIRQTSNFVFRFDFSDIVGYQNLSTENFIILTNELRSHNYSSFAGLVSFSKNFDSSTGILNYTIINQNSASIALFAPTSFTAYCLNAEIDFQ